MMEALYVAIASRFDADPDNEHFDTADLLRAGLAAHQLSLAKNVARVCLLIGAPPDSAKPNRFAMPADAEMIAESRRSGRSFLDYLLHAACEAKSNDHFAVKRPWPTAPLWIGRDGSQPDYVPIALLHEVTIPTEPEVTDLEAPERFEVPGFDLLDPLPAGASGEVYRAKENWDGGIERVVKIFVPHPFADDHDPEPRFRSEVQALYRLQHRAVVRYVTSGVLLSPRRAFYLVMEWVNGDRLSNRYQSMPFDTRVQTMIEILGGLHHAHQAKIFHRDVKPSNIMIRESDGQAVLVDFGLAYLVGDELDDDRTRQVLGTPGYIPPEVANNPKLSRDPRHDVFQAGVTLYEILVGRLPRENYITVESINPRLAALDPILQRAMSPLPETRYQSAQEFAQALAAWIEQDARAARAENSAPQTNAAPSFARAIELQSRQLREEQTEQQRRVEIVAAANRALAPTYEAIRSRLNAIAQAARDQGLPVSQAELVNEHPIEITLSALKEQTGSVRLFECHARPARGVPFAISLDCEYRPMLPAAWPLRFTLAINPGPDYPDNDVVHMLDGSPYTSWVRERTTNEHFPRLLEKWLDEPAHWAAFDVT
ncbi:MAG: protein kinase [Deltaproteobacteria bacterium]|nr:protein kinase [Deltaproteobacteria bacterium]